MPDVLQAVFHVFGEIGSGGEASPLSVNSPYSEILRLAQVGIFAGILYLIKALKETKSVSHDTHGEILSQISNLTDEIQRQRNERKNEIQVLREEVQRITTRKQELADK